MSSSPHAMPASPGPDVGSREAVWHRPGTRVSRDIDWVVATAPAPPCLTRRLWEQGERLLGESPTMLWDEPSGERWVALGNAAKLEAAGPDRIPTLVTASEHLLRRVKAVSLPGQPTITPRLVGGLSFAPGMVREPPWQDFPESFFALPRWLYVERNGSASLCAAFRASQPDAKARCWQSLTDAVAALSTLAPDGEATTVQDYRIEHVEVASDSVWSELVQRVQTRLTSGELQKVVLARRTRLTLDRHVDSGWLLARLRRESPGCTVFAVRHGAATFLGATPEWLLRLEAGVVYTEALAGSGSVESGAAALLGSTKDRAEHDLVVRQLVEALSPLSNSLSRARAPEVLRLPRLLHLRTPIVARLSHPSHPLALVARLHPSPAVGGVPTSAALEAIKEVEPHERGWYAAPLGWLDANASARFVIALRSGVLAQDRVDAFAGAGIMPDSSPALEAAEVRLKQQSFLQALGVRT